MKIVLAIDLDEIKIYEGSVVYEELANWTNELKSNVLPVYVTSKPEKHLDEERYELLLQDFANLKTITIPEGGRKNEIDALLKFAHEQKANLIALSSQGKSTIEKKLLGSFAEALLVKSDLPLLFLEEVMSHKHKENRVLFATDFSSFSEQAFSLFLEHNKFHMPEIVLFHAIQLPQFFAAAPIYSQALSVLPQSYWDEQKEIAETHGKKLIQLAESQGFQIRLEISNQVFSVENSIHEIVRREKVRLVGIISVSSPTERFLLGSVSRSILRTRIKPIWICGAHCSIT